MSWSVISLARFGLAVLRVVGLAVWGCLSAFAFGLASGRFLSPFQLPILACLGQSVGWFGLLAAFLVFAGRFSRLAWGYSMSILFGGSRHLSPAFAPLVASVVLQVISKGFKVHTGCCSGADALVIQAAIQRPGSLSVFAIGNKFGRGFWSCSSYQWVSVAAHMCESVTWLAGGNLNVPLRVRLINRSLAALKGCSAAIFFLSGRSSPGSLAVAAQAVKRGAQVFVFPCGFGFTFPPASPTPKAGLRPKCAGSWQLSSFAGHKCWQWVPNQASMF